MHSMPGLLSKVGAEGVIAVAVPGVGAVALKIDDGAARARMPVLVPALGVLGVAASELDEMAEVASSRRRAVRSGRCARYPVRWPATVAERTSTATVSEQYHASHS